MRRTEEACVQLLVSMKKRSPSSPWRNRALHRAAAQCVRLWRRMSRRCTEIAVVWTVTSVRRQPRTDEHWSDKRASDSTEQVCIFTGHILLQRSDVLHGYLAGLRILLLGARPLTQKLLRHGRPLTVNKRGRLQVPRHSILHEEFLWRQCQSLIDAMQENLISHFSARPTLGCCDSAWWKSVQPVISNKASCQQLQHVEG